MVWFLCEDTKKKAQSKFPFYSCLLFIVSVTFSAQLSLEESRKERVHCFLIDCPPPSLSVFLFLLHLLPFSPQNPHLRESTPLLASPWPQQGQQKKRSEPSYRASWLRASKPRLRVACGIGGIKNQKKKKLRKSPKLRRGPMFSSCLPTPSFLPFPSLSHALPSSGCLPPSLVFHSPPRTQRLFAQLKISSKHGKPFQTESRLKREREKLLRDVEF